MMPLRLTVSPSTAPRPNSLPAPTPEDLSFINHLRVVALACRSKGRSDLFQACALIYTDPLASRDTYAEALMRCLAQAMTTRPVMLRTGSPELSFDEAWLVQLAKALARNNNDSAEFLLRSRIDRSHRRNIRFLVTGISECFALV